MRRQPLGLADTLPSLILPALPTAFGYLGTGSVSVVLAGVVLSLIPVLVVYTIDATRSGAATSCLAHTLAARDLAGA